MTNEKAANKILEHKSYWERLMRERLCEKINGAETIEAFEKAVEALKAEPKSEWIPIKTRPLTEKEKAEMGTESDDMYDCPLPDDGEEVEITTYLGDVTMDTFCRESGGCYFENYCDDGDVLAWRHKPEPYKAEGEGV